MPSSVGRVLGQVLPLALGAAVNTRVLATQAVLVSRPGESLRPAIAFGAGAAAPLFAIGAVALVSVHLATSAISDERALLASSVGDVAVGGLLLLVAWLLRSGQSPRGGVDPGPGVAASTGTRRTFLRGAATMGTDLSTMVMFATAAKDDAIGRLGAPWEIGVFALALGIALVPAWLPPVLSAVSPASATRLVLPLGRAVRRHGRAVGRVVLAAVGVYLVVRGALGLA